MVAETIRPKIKLAEFYRQQAFIRDGSLIRQLVFHPDYGPPGTRYMPQNKDFLKYQGPAGEKDGVSASFIDSAGLLAYLGQEEDPFFTSTVAAANCFEMALLEAFKIQGVNELTLRGEANPAETTQQDRPLDIVVSTANLNLYTALVEGARNKLGDGLLDNVAAAYLYSLYYLAAQMKIDIKDLRLPAYQGVLFEYIDSSQDGVALTLLRLPNPFTLTPL